MCGLFKIDSSAVKTEHWQCLQCVMLQQQFACSNDGQQQAWPLRVPPGLGLLRTTTPVFSLPVLNM